MLTCTRAVRRERIAVEAVQVEADVAARRFLAGGATPEVLEKATDDVHLYCTVLRFVVVIPCRAA